jgi:uncharacterized protein
MSVALINGRTGDALANIVEIAVTRTSRRRGLLGRRSLAPSSALILAPCAAVHTAFMQFDIDVVFVDRNGYAVKLHAYVPPFRMAISTRAHAVIELAAGSLRRTRVQLGDRLHFDSVEGGVETMAAVLAKASGSSPSLRSEWFSGISPARR